MEIEGEDGSKISIKPNSKTEFGRGTLNSSSTDTTISRRHISLELQTSPNSEPRVSFQVLGKNPIWIYRRENGNTEVFRRFDKGEMGIGDSFCVSAVKPVLFKLKKSEEEESRRGVALVEKEMVGIVQSGIEGNEVVEELGIEHVDVSDIDPVKDFGFLVIGHEFDSYPKTRIRAINNWNWFLEESRVDSDTDEHSEGTRSKGKKNIRRKRKGEGNDDEEWTGDSDEDKDVISKVGKGKKPRFTTRSKDLNRSLGGLQSSRKSEQKKIDKGIEEEDDEDDDDDEETLGGFIVSDEELDEDEEEEEEEEEEEADEDENEDEDDG